MFGCVFMYLFFVFAVEVLWTDLQRIWEDNSRPRPLALSFLLFPVYELLTKILLFEHCSEKLYVCS